MMPDFKFQEKGHLYTLDGIAIPSVTQVLPDNPHNKDDYSMNRGTLVHKTIYLYNIGDLDEDTLDEQLKPYLEAYNKFRKDCPDIRGIVELKSGSPSPTDELQVAGYCLLVNAQNPPFSDKPLKGYEVPLYHLSYKYAGIIDILELDSLPCRKAYNLYLSGDGKYDLIDRSKDLRRNESIFLSFLTTYQWKKERGLI